MNHCVKGLGIVALTLALMGCDGGTTEATPSTPRGVGAVGGVIQVTCTVGMLADIVREVGGERVEVASLMGPGTDPHLYQATSGDRLKLSGADTIFYGGHHLEGKLGETLERFSRKIPTLAVCEQLPPERLLAAGDPPVVDPHLWFDVTLWARATEVIRDSLMKFDAAGADTYQSNAARYLQTLHSLHDEVTRKAASIPERQRVLVTAHDAFGYFGRAYGFEVLGIQGISTDSEPAVQRINELVKLMVDRNIPAVFVESTVSEKNIQSLIEGCAARGHTVKIGGSLYSDAMGGAGTPAETYVGMVRHNIDTIVEALR